MSSSSGYEDEMGRFLRLSDEELSRLLAGEAGVRDEALDEVASLLGEVRETFSTTAPDEATRGLHLAAISEASQLAADKGTPVVRPVSKAHGSVSGQASGLPKWRRVMDRTVSIALKALAGTVAASMSMVGLAYAGVDLPGQAAERALEAVTGLELPNQGPESSDSSVADDVKGVIDSSTEEGCEFGQAVADAADSNREDDATTETDPCAQADEAGDDAQGSKATGDEKSAEGRAKAGEASGGASDGSADNAGTNDDSGRSTADDASTTGSSSANEDAENAGTKDDDGRTTGEESSTSGQQQGDEKSDTGQSHNPTGEGRP